MGLGLFAVVGEWETLHNGSCLTLQQRANLKVYHKQFVTQASILHNIRGCLIA